MGDFKQAVSAIIFKDSSILLIKRRDIPVWVLPGGGLDPFETVEEGICREVLEETGCNVEIVRKIAEYQPINKLTQLTHFFECKILSGTPQEGPETKEIAFFPIDALPKFLAPPYLSWIQDALLRKPQVLCKPIEGVSYFDLFKHLFLHPFLVIRFLLTKIGIHINR